MVGKKKVSLAEVQGGWDKNMTQEGLCPGSTLSCLVMHRHLQHAVDWYGAIHNCWALGVE